MNSLLKIMCVLSLAVTGVLAEDHKDSSMSFTLGTVRSGLRVLCEVPLANISTNAVTACSPVWTAAKDIFHTKGFSGFYSGISAESARALLWYPRMWILRNGPNYYANNVGCSASTGEYLTAATITAFESVLMPLYRYRTALMAEQREVVKRSTQQILRSAYSGTALRATPTFISWAVFLKSEAYAKQHYANAPVVNSLITMGPQILIGFLSSPIYVVLLNRQKLTEPCNMAFIPAVKHYYARCGSSVFLQNGIMGAAMMGVGTLITLIVARYNAD